jgi:simple sugar transport system substrate-binding protein
MNRKMLTSISAAALLLALAGEGLAQGIEKAVGGYSFGDAAKENDATRDFHSKDGKLTFAIVTHTAGNGFFDPVYVGATVAAI